MSLPKFNKDIKIISKLDDEPNDVGGLSANELKAKFDEAGNLIKAFINDTLLPYLESVSGAGDIGIANIPGLNDAATVQAALQELKKQINNTSTGSIPDRSLTGNKLVTGAVGTNELANASVTSGKIANGAVNDSKIAAEKLSGASIQAKAIQNSHLNGKVIKAENVEDNSLTGDQIKDLSIPAGKIASGAVQTAKIANSAITESKIASGAVTRAKLANDALYSPVKAITADRNIEADDLGKTLKPIFSSSSTTFTLTLDAASSTSLPTGSEIAVCLLYNLNKVNIAFSGVRVIYLAGGRIASKDDNVTVTIPEVGGMLAIKKMEIDSAYGDLWLLTGNAEVVS